MCRPMFQKLFSILQLLSLILAMFINRTIFDYLEINDAYSLKLQVYSNSDYILIL